MLRGQPIDPKTLSVAAPRLVDSVDRDELVSILRKLPEQVVASHGGLAFALGYSALVEGATESGTRWLVEAQSALRREDHLLRARIAFELGALYITRNYTTPADILLLDSDAEGHTGLGDLLHLRALIAESRGDHQHATMFYRDVLNAEVQSLSPSTRVLAMINLAASIHHRYPTESLALTELAIEMINARELHPRLRPAGLNIMGYALICLGRLQEARRALVSAGDEAARYGYQRVALYAAFNQAIIDELIGDYGSADVRLDEVARRSAVPFPVLAGWVRIRQTWLAWLVGSAAEAGSLLAAAQSDLRDLRYAESIMFLDAILAGSAGKSSHALAGFASVRRSAALRGDAATELAALLHLAHADRRVGGDKRAQPHVRRALALLHETALNLSPNWWCHDVVDAFVNATTDPMARALVLPAVPRSQSDATPTVVTLRSDGSAKVDEDNISLNWQRGRTGRHMLLRLFRTLLESHPHGIRREDLADRLWPESDGDAAIRNLYAATNDLRKVLADIPGVRLDVADSRYSLILSNHVRLVDASPDETAHASSESEVDAPTTKPP